MGGFCQNIYVFERTQSAAEGGLKQVLTDSGFTSFESGRVTGPTWPKGDEPLYLISPQQGRWTTILEAHSYSEGASTADIARALSRSLGTFVLHISVHDDDVLFFNLFSSGADLDCYNSCPQYFEQERLSDEQILEQRHSPDAFLPLLPPGATMQQLKAILNSDWWDEFEQGHLDKDGAMTLDKPKFVFESNRLAAVANLLQLHGRADGYPTYWADNKSISWAQFISLTAKRMKQP